MPPKPKVTEAELNEVFDERDDANPFLTTGDVARELDVSTETARKYLHDNDEYVSYNAGRGQIWLREHDRFEDRKTEKQLADGGGTLSFWDWLNTYDDEFERSLRDYYPFRILPLSLITGMVAWYYANIVSAIVVSLSIYIGYPAAVLLATFVYFKLIKPHLASTGESPENPIT